VGALLDTHVWVWTQEQPERLGPRTKRLLVGDEHENWVCPISTLEIARLVAAGDIRLGMPLADRIMRGGRGWADVALRAGRGVLGCARSRQLPSSTC
jgi:PIN domain nuclease of toxin-antitoxin system